MKKRWMNHDYTHCLDFTPKCPHRCFRAQLERDLKDRWTEFVGMPISYAHFHRDGLCQIDIDEKSEVDE